jgi:hypothetical protein
MAPVRDRHRGGGSSRLARWVTRGLMTLGGTGIAVLVSASFATSASADDGDGGSLGGLVSGITGSVHEVTAPVTEPAGQVAGTATGFIADDVAAAATESAPSEVGEAAAPSAALPVSRVVVEPVAAQVIEPVVRDVVTPVVEQTVTPVVDDVIEPALRDLSPATDAVSAALIPATGVVAEAIRPVTDGVVAPVVAGVVRPAAKVIEPVVGPLTSAIAPALSPVRDAADPVLTPVRETVGVIPADSENPGSGAPAGPEAIATDPASAAVTPPGRPLSAGATTGGTHRPFGITPADAVLISGSERAHAPEPRVGTVDVAITASGPPAPGAPASSGTAGMSHTAGSADADLARGLTVPANDLSVSPATAPPSAFLEVLLEVAVAPD